MANNPRLAQVSLGNAWASYQQGQYEAAAASCKAAVQADSGNADAWHLFGVVTSMGGDYAQAIGHYRHALNLVGDNPDILANLASALAETGDLAGAEHALLSALQRAPRHAAVFNNLGNLYVKQGRMREAMNAYDQTLLIAPQHLNALKALSELLLRENHPGGAAQLAKRALSLSPGDLKALRLLAQSSLLNKSWQELLHAADGVLMAVPDDGEMRRLKFIALCQVKRYGAAVKAFEHLPAELRMTPTLLSMGADALAISGQAEKALSLLESMRLGERIAAEVASQYLFLLNYSERPVSEIIAAHAAWGDAFAPQARAPLPVARPKDDPARPLRIGFLSGELRAHSVAFFLEPLLAAFDHERLQVIAYHYGHLTDEVTARLKRLCDGWRELAGRSSNEIADIIRNDQIDILIELSGHTGENVFEALALRPAPVQVSYLGYPNTTGLSAIAYRISDAVADPDDRQQLGFESLVRLPDCFHCYAGDESVPLPIRGASEQRVFTFGSFNNLPKISEATIAAWARILTEVAGSRLLLKSHALADEEVRAQLLARFAQHGIDASRIDLRAVVANHHDHLALYGEIDVALDPFPYNGTTTTCEALWMGVPVIGIVGDRHAGRVGASLLHAVGHDELLAPDVDGYVRLASDVAGNAERLGHYHQCLRDEMRASPLMDAPRFARHFEAALLEMWQQSCAKSGAAYCSTSSPSDH